MNSEQVYFADIIGQEPLKRSLIQTVRAGHVSHALMISGPDGGGNLPLALAFAGYVFCENPGDTDRCGTCRACKAMDHLSYPDLHFSFPFILKENTKTSESFQRDFVRLIRRNPYLTLKDWEQEIAAENKKTIIPVKESEEIIKKLRLKSFYEGHKILIIWMPEKLKTEASNKLLKTLEEPAPKTIIILVTSAPDELLPTVISRTQMVRCLPLKEEDISSALAAREGITKERADSAARLAKGDYSLARSIARREDEGEEFFTMLSKWLRACVGRKLFEALESSEEIAKLSRDDQQRFLEYSLNFLHESLVYSVIGPEQARFEGEAAEFAVKFAPFIIGRDLGGFHDLFTQTHYLVGRNANPYLLYMKASYEMMKLFERKAEPVS